VFLKPLLEGLWDQLHGKVLEHRHHLLALACLAKAAGPGADPMAVARFCKKYKLPLTMPVVGLIPRVLSKVDITGAVATGVKIMAALGPLLGKIRLRNAMLYALDEAVVPSGDSAEVGMILESASSPKQVMAAAKQKASEVKKLKADVERYAAKLKRIEAKLGAGKGTSGSGRR
jgi:Cys-tRNA synthase (O-phospho-L-seryl-tRNA:Cys-tRNA synthase)